MAGRETEAGRAALDKVLGYLNFSSGATDPQFLSSLSLLFEDVDHRTLGQQTWLRLFEWLQTELQSLPGTNPAFQDVQQAQAVLQITFEKLLPAYREFHRDLLFHQTSETLFRPFFLARALETVLRQGPPWAEHDRIVTASIKQLSDYIGHRPVAALESQRIEPYPHEFCRPIPLYIRGAGIAYGPEREVIGIALQLLEGTDENLLRQACFFPHRLEELAFDPRAYDFDHPANKRPNYHFGQWDPHQIDHHGFYRRFVVQQITLDALMRRLTEETNLSQEELKFEAAAVLAGTVLMASGISGEGPGAHDSTITLAKLLPRIAKYRDGFYEQLLQRTTGEHRERLLNEAAQKRQPFGGARQHLNAQLARSRASQLEHVHLARIFARLGHVEAAAKQANVVPCASARMLCQIDCLLTTCQLACAAGKLEAAADVMPQITDLLKRAIQCGAVIDPWNILGFDAHFSLFPALENSVRDHRADELVALMERIWTLYSLVWSEAAASNRAEISERIARQFKKTASWWHQFATHEVSTVDALDSLGMFRAAERVAKALQVWHEGGAASGDVGFWAPHAEMFDSPKAYAMVIDSLLERGDSVASMALMMSWLSRADAIGLEHGDSSFHDLAQRWVTSTTAAGDESPEAALKVWDSARKFLDYLEANAEGLWNVPRFELGNGKRSASAAAQSDDDDDEENPFGSAYEGVVYRDSTDDGVDGAIFESGDDTHDEMQHQSKQVAERLAFLATVARLWKQTIVSPAFAAIIKQHASSEPATAAMQQRRTAAMQRWIEQAQTNIAGLNKLLASVRDYRIPNPSGDHDSMVEYDRRRMIKESLLERVVATSVEMADAARLLLAARSAVNAGSIAEISAENEETIRTVAVFTALLKRDEVAVQEACELLFKTLLRQPLLYVPLAKGGNPPEIVLVRTRQHAIQDLLAWLPRCGLWIETCQLLDTSRQMERDHPVGPGAVTEFDELFKIGYKGIVESLVVSAQSWQRAPGATDDQAAEPLVACLEQLTESMLTSWLAHSRTLRLSVLERVHDKTTWKRVVAFVEKYGADLFTQRFLNLSNIRAIMHQGPAKWLKSLQEEPADDAPQKLLEDLTTDAALEENAELLGMVLEAIVENYGEYRDYNSTTTQSDRGELLYMLLDFLRLRTRYDRVCWNLKPVVLAHEILVRRGEDIAARVWRRALSERIQDEAEQYLTRLADLQKKYAMRMPTVADRLAERFIRPLTIDRIRALVEPAIEEARVGGDAPKFAMLEFETATLTREPTGVGLDVPAWLVALEEEVDLTLRPTHERQEEADLAAILPPKLLTLAEAKVQLDHWTTKEE
jgi:predicted heme/steroid binding protein